MTYDKSEEPCVHLQEISLEEYIIVVKCKNKIIANLYIRGDRKYAEQMTELAKKRITVKLIDENPDQFIGKINLELTRLKESFHR